MNAGTISGIVAGTVVGMVVVLTSVVILFISCRRPKAAFQPDEDTTTGASVPVKQPEPDATKQELSA